MVRRTFERQPTQRSNVRIYKAKGELDTALKYLKDAQEIFDEFKLVDGRAIVKNAIDSITN